MGMPRLGWDVADVVVLRSSEDVVSGLAWARERGAFDAERVLVLLVCDSGWARLERACRLLATRLSASTCEIALRTLRDDVLRAIGDLSTRMGIGRLFLAANEPSTPELALRHPDLVVREPSLVA